MILHSKIFGQGLPFLILHGFLGMGDNWKTMAMQFSKLGYQMHLIDQRNHGRSFHSNIFDYEVMALDILNYCESQDIKKCIVLGHSMGGKTAMMFAALYPDFVQKLIIADIAPRYYPIHHDMILRGLQSLNFSQIHNRKQADEKLSEYVSEVPIRQFLLKNLYRKSPSELALRLNLKVLQEQVHEVGEALPAPLSVKVKTLFLRGDRSEYIGLQDQHQIKLQFPQATIVTIPNAGHWLHAENPEAFYKAIVNFLR